MSSVGGEVPLRVQACVLTPAHMENVKACIAAGSPRDGSFVRLSNFALTSSDVAEIAEAIRKTPYVVGVNLFNDEMHTTPITPILRALVGCPVRTLTLSGNVLGEEDVDLILEIMGRNGSHVGKKIGGTPFTGMMLISLERCGLGLVAAAKISSAIAERPSVQKVLLGHNRIGVESASTLVRAATSCREYYFLTLSGAGLDMNDAKKITEIIAQSVGRDGRCTLGIRCDDALATAEIEKAANAAGIGFFVPPS